MHQFMLRLHVDAAAYAPQRSSAGVVSRPSRCAPPGAARGGWRAPGPEGTLAIGVGDGFAPAASRRGAVTPGGRRLAPAAYPGSQLVPRIERAVLTGGLPGPAAHAHEQPAHRRDGVDQTLPDDKTCQGSVHLISQCEFEGCLGPRNQEQCVCSTAAVRGLSE